MSYQSRPNEHRPQQTNSSQKTPPRSPDKPRKDQKRRSGSVPVVKAGGKRQLPWLTIGAVAVVAVIIAALAVYLVPKFQSKQEAQKWVPTASNPDPSKDIAGVTKVYYPAGQHVTAAQRVAYDQSPPFGGPHDQVWATCTGIVYPKPLRSENAVHALEHGSIWITYNPDSIKPGDLDALKQKVTGQQYTLMSPYPGLSSPISVQSWGHQLKLDSASDQRIDHFITALRRNSQKGSYSGHPDVTTYPEVGAECAAIPGAFDPSNPPAADSGPLPKDAVPMNGTGTTAATDENGAAAPTPAG
ncbi:DUF3105 domain-containing protein [Williamsia sterculiae]|uniref:DUF3105 domain-containing protein n=1 Tax=Williamsia sterculiae TaxID=1344003 RepID=A0A1N7E216_9NOCA|nr:DUF3105 domain-containing protein [Williamsia sterculiae]SIR82114.1 Protein of unknown function [Williamsia sterculiae]